MTDTSSQTEAAPRSRRLQLRAWDVAAFLAFCLPIVLYFWNVIYYSADVPIQDDFDIFGFMFNWLDSQTLVQKLQWLIMQHNEHRMAWQRVVALAEYQATGKIDFSFLTVFGALGWGLTLLLLCFWLVKKHGFSFSQLLPIPYIMLLFTQSNNMLMATAAIPFYWAILFSVLGLLLLSLKKTTLACIAFVAALFTHGSGLILFPIGTAYLLLDRRRGEAAVYGIWCLLFTFVYFTNYRFTSDASFGGALAHFGTLVAFILAFVGNIIPSIPVAVVLGLLLGGALVYFAWRRSGEHFLALLAVWILATAAVTAVTRYSLGLVMAISSRYAPFALLGAVLVYAWLLETSREDPGRDFQPRNVVTASTVVAAALFFAFLLQYSGNGAFPITRQDKIAGASYLAQTGQWNMLMLPVPFQETAGKGLIQAQQAGFYDYSRVLGIRYPVSSSSDSASNGTFLGNVDGYDGMYINGWATIEGSDTRSQRIMIVLKNADRMVALEPTRVLRWDVSSVYQQPGYLFSGYTAYLAAYAVPPGSYQLGILVRNGANQALSWTTDSYMAP